MSYFLIAHRARQSGMAKPIRNRAVQKLVA
jgi:hypothetical protein